MDLSNYFNDLPLDLVPSGAVEEAKLLKLYAYNAYFNADPLCIEDVNNGCNYSRAKPYNLDGVFVNQSLEENTIEVLYAKYVNNSILTRNDLTNILVALSGSICDVCDRVYQSKNKSEDLLRDYLQESADNKEIIIRIITDYTCDDKTKLEYQKHVENFSLQQPKQWHLTAILVFGDEAQAVVESNKAPYEYVQDGKLLLDSGSNFLRFSGNSIVCNISALSLRKLWKAEGDRGLLAMNLRYYIKSKNIDQKIEDSILYDGHNFWYLNNGIIIVCDDYSIVGNELRLKNFSIVNGGQTSRMIGNIPFDDDFLICCKVIKNVFEDPKEKNLFIAKVAEATNTQKPIKIKDIIANRVEQRNLKTLLSDNGIFIEIKRGEKCNHDIYSEPWQRTKNNELAQDLLSFMFLQPGPARNSVSSILQNKDKYDLIFVNHEYSAQFIKDLLFLEKAYKEYNKKIAKADDTVADAIKRGLVKNGLYYTLSIIGYILKIGYNKEYQNCVCKYRNNQALYDSYSQEMAFFNPFIKEKTYKEFLPNAFKLFDYVFSTFIIQEFNSARSTNPSLVYSNWTKTNTGFERIKSNFNSYLFDSKNTNYLNTVMSYFIEITDEQQNENIDRYVDYCKKNKNIKAKSSSGFELTANDEQLRNALMVYRLDYSTKKHIAEKMIYTDKMIDSLIIEKPLNLNDLKKIINNKTVYFCGNDILEIIKQYI